uniref:c-Myc-binding protein n=1 Tax=Pyramimonas obovata TaxID=1411642 RepID=A0A7S0N2T6_9CHLO|mmetsp:Transcript_18871/g.41343  ORF Transcript_18871/g.41343 Transcript_18871/m.41343 type:complete len:101 (+) Transcript_18871:119-421(+)|eukprot:CAMPEP_0118935284 /NCGR_PEP_ID=MMETSP1169-20130426/15350_1 /TAXON_ID=36882 /ORGANISM="Pyramimonas obovata, Strain CCMP722" /LENGTH=100 /DNA_ID=CAMNT_0006878299 /DNA_START=76 /DNA_END=378 /DNA_ORIENTATION=+
MATDSKKEAFRRFLETAGVIDMLTKSLVQLYEEPEKPGNAIDYVRTAFGAPTPAEFDALTADKNGLEAKVTELEAHIKELMAKIEELENPPNDEGEETTD